MPVIMKNNIPYCSADMIQIEETTMDNYKSLESSGSVDNETLYCIADGEEGYDSIGVLYDDSKTNLKTRNVQHAIENIHQKYVDYLNIFAFQGIIKKNISIAKDTSMNLNYNIAKEGFKPIGIISFEFANSASSGAGCSLINCNYVECSVENNTLKVAGRATYSSASKVDFTALIMYVKSEYYKYFKPSDAIAV